MKTLFLLITLAASSCIRITVEPLKEFDLNRYMGVWHEIARLDHPFERNLQNVTATYAITDEGRVSVINRGFNSEKGVWEEANAYALTTPNQGQFKVYFVPIIWGNYKIAYIDPDYTFAVVSGGTKGFLWFLAREKSVSAETLAKMKSVAESLGYDTTKLIYP